MSSLHELTQEALKGENSIAPKFFYTCLDKARKGSDDSDLKRTALSGGYKFHCGSISSYRKYRWWSLKSWIIPESIRPFGTEYNRVAINAIKSKMLFDHHNGWYLPISPKVNIKLVWDVDPYRKRWFTYETDRYNLFITWEK